MKNFAVVILGSELATTDTPFSSAKVTLIFKLSIDKVSIPLLMTMRASKAWRSRVSSCWILILTMLQTVAAEAIAGASRHNNAAIEVAPADHSER